MGVMTLEMEYKMRENRARSQGMQKGLEQGLEQGISQGIRAFILSNRKAGNSESKIKEELMEWFDLSEAEAEGYLQKFTK